jgi:hypothetical protein
MQFSACVLKVQPYNSDSDMSVYVCKCQRKSKIHLRITDKDILHVTVTGTKEVGWDVRMVIHLQVNITRPCMHKYLFVNF